MSETWEFQFNSAKNAAEAKKCFESAAPVLSTSHALMLRAMLMARDAGNEKVAEVFKEEANRLKDSMMYFAAVELYLVNQMAKENPSG